MRNECKHENKVILSEEWIKCIKVWWCKICGATKYSWKISGTWEIGKWKSPKIATTKNL